MGSSGMKRRGGESDEGQTLVEGAHGELVGGAGGELDGDGPPEDKYHTAYFIFFSLGCGFLFPWNAFITAADYFGTLYPWAHVDRVFPVAYMFPNLVFLALLILFGRGYSPSSRILVGFTFFFLIMLGMPLLDLFSGGVGTPFTLFVTIIAVSGLGILDALVQGSLFGAAAELPPKYTQALVGGTAVSGVSVSLLRCLTKAALPNTRSGLRASAALYFLISAAFTGWCVVAFAIVEKLPVIRYYKKWRMLGPEGSVGQQLRREDEKDLARDAAAEAGLMQGGPSLISSNSAPSELQALMDAPILLPTQVSFVHVMSQMWPKLLMITLVYWVTLSIFPGFMAEDVKSDWLGDWYPLLLILSFNFFDFLGKMSPVCFVIDNDSMIAALVVARLLFYPGFFFGVWGPKFGISELPIVLLTCALGYSNGVLTSNLMMAGPTCVSLHEAETAGTLMVLFLVIGLTLGAFSGWLWLL